MLAKYLLLAVSVVCGTVQAAALDAPAGRLRNGGQAVDDRRAGEAEAARQRKEQNQVNRDRRERENAGTNAGGHPTTSGMRPKKRAIEEIVRRAVDEALYGAGNYLSARDIYEADDLYAREEVDIFARDVYGDYDYYY